MEPSVSAGAIIWLETADSTNRALRSRIPGLDNLSIVATREQTAGRGQGSHTWHSSPGLNLTFSILYRFDGPFSLDASEAILITQVTSLALRDYLLERGVSARIKWPNDFWVGERKICGILIENELAGKSIRRSITGIGLNLNESAWPEDLPNPVSLRELSGREYVQEEELPVLQEAICRRFGALASPDGRKGLQEEL